MAIEGPIKELNLMDLFQLLAMSRKSGVLTLDSTQNVGQVFFSNGNITRATLQQGEEKLGQMMVRDGKLSAGEVDSLLMEQAGRKPRRPLGSLAVEMASLPKNVVMEKLRAQVEDVVAIILDWHDGYFRFEEMELPADLDLGFSLVTENVIMEVSRRLDEWSKIRSRLPDLDMVLVLSPVSDVTTGKLDIRPEEWLILASIDGRRTARQVIQTVGGGEFETAKVIYGLIATGLVRVTGRRSPLEMEVQQPVRDPLAGGVAKLRAGDVKGAIEDFARILQQETDNPGAHLHLAEAYYQSESFDEAVMEYKLASQGQDNDPEINYLLGYTYAKLGRLELAVERWERYLAYAGSEARAEEVRDLVRLAVRWAERLEQRAPAWAASKTKAAPAGKSAAGDDQLPAEAKAWLERMRSARPLKK
ncbi:MAG TPA: hypothetical protein DDW31_00920 [candidate division Zixibacteria bacterium]|nr:hypothetical protein [candidate division Zixibacteria bacterium]